MARRRACTSWPLASTPRCVFSLNRFKCGYILERHSASTHTFAETRRHSLTHNTHSKYTQPGAAGSYCSAIPCFEGLCPPTHSPTLAHTPHTLTNTHSPAPPAATAQRSPVLRGCAAAATAGLCCCPLPPASHTHTLRSICKLCRQALPAAIARRFPALCWHPHRHSHTRHTLKNTHSPAQPAATAQRSLVLRACAAAATAGRRFPVTACLMIWRGRAPGSTKQQVRGFDSRLFDQRVQNKQAFPGRAAVCFS